MDFEKWNERLIESIKNIVKYSGNLSNFDKYIPFAKVFEKEIDCKLGDIFLR